MPKETMEQQERKDLTKQMSDIQNDTGGMKKDIGWIKDITREMKEMLKAVNNSVETVRKDVNIANQMGIENQYKIKDLELEQKAQALALKEDYVTKQEFLPVKMVVFGAVGLILTIVFSGLVYLVVTVKH
jgi:hypothetical protein